MNRWRAEQHPGGEDVLSPYRERVMYLLGILGVVVLLPLAVNDFLRGLHSVGFGVLILVVILGINAFAVYRQKSPPIPLGLLVLAGILGIGVSIRTQGFYGALWSYPAVLFFYFVLSQRAANFYNCVLAVLVTGMVYYYLGLETTVRFLLTMTLTIVSSNIFLSIINNLQGQLLEQSIVDPLTGAFNRRHMEFCLSDALERKRRHRTPASLLLLDIDHFKQINDQLGHAAGDGVLKALVALIRQRSRKGDLLFRVGCEEFVLFLPDTDEKHAVIAGEHLRACVAESELLEGRQVSISVGVSELRVGESLDRWYRQADAVCLDRH